VAAPEWRRYPDDGAAGRDVRHPVAQIASSDGLGDCRYLEKGTGRYRPSSASRSSCERVQHGHPEDRTILVLMDSTTPIVSAIFHVGHRRFHEDPPRQG
jgi:hypothetical protein